MTGAGLVMRNLTFAVSTAIATTIFGLGAASAADLPVKAYPKAPAAIAAVYNWTGFYVGPNVGCGWVNHHTTLPSDPAFVGPNFSALLDSANAAASKPA